MTWLLSDRQLYMLLAARPTDRRPPAAAIEVRATIIDGKSIREITQPGAEITASTSTIDTDMEPARLQATAESDRESEQRI